MVKTTRLLLPFMHGVEMDTLEAAVLFAASHHATLVPLSLVPAPLQIFLQAFRRSSMERE